MHLFKPTFIALIVCIYSYSLCNPVKVQPLETNRLFLRPAQMSDSNDIAQIALNPNVTQLTGLFPPIKNEADVKDFVSQFLIGNARDNKTPKYPLSWVMVDKQLQKVVGLITFVAYLEHHKRAEIAYATAQEVWNKGYTTEACASIIQYVLRKGLNRVYATVDPENKASERVLQKLGMSCEGLLRSYMIVNGQPRDRKLYARVTH